MNSPSDDLATTFDPTRGFHPLISVYSMVKEKMERERMSAPSGVAPAVDGGLVASRRDGDQYSGVWAAQRVDYGTDRFV